MKKCLTCGKELPCDARFCYICGTAVHEIAPMEDEEIIVSPVIKRESSKDEKSSSFVVNEPIISMETTDEDRQALLDKIRSKLRGERTIWLIAAIFSIVAYVFVWFGFISSFVYFVMDEEYYYDEYYDDSYDEYNESIEFPASEILFLVFMYGALYGFYIFVPVTVFGFIMAAKAKKCLKSLYRDCSYSYRRCSSPTVIIFAAAFNPLALFFAVPLFKLSRDNARLLKEIAKIQYNYYNYYPEATNNY